jgi:hypothetical protein
MVAGLARGLANPLIRTPAARSKLPGINRARQAPKGLPMSSHISRYLQIGKIEPDLFSPRPVLVHPATRAARKLAARYGLSLAHAATIISLLGINEEAH